MAIYDDFVFAGHGIINSNGSYDPGATRGNVKENDLTRQIASKIVEYKKGAGINTQYAENHYSNNNTNGNTYVSKSGVSIHINAGRGRGAEIYVPSKEIYLDTEINILNRLNKEIGLVNRGVKSRDYHTEATVVRTNGAAINQTDYYKEIRQTWEQRVSLSIIEVGFIDTEDLKLIQDNIDKIALIVAQETAKLLSKTINQPETPKPPTSPTTPNKPTSSDIKRVIVDGKQVGAYKENKNVLDQVEKALNENKNKISIERL